MRIDAERISAVLSAPFDDEAETVAVVSLLSQLDSDPMIVRLPAFVATSTHTGSPCHQLTRHLSQWLDGLLFIWVSPSPRRAAQHSSSTREWHKLQHLAAEAIMALCRLRGTLNEHEEELEGDASTASSLSSSSVFVVRGVYIVSYFCGNRERMPSVRNSLTSLSALPFAEERADVLRWCDRFCNSVESDLVVAYRALTAGSSGRVGGADGRDANSAQLPSESTRNADSPLAQTTFAITKAELPPTVLPQRLVTVALLACTVARLLWSVADALFHPSKGPFQTILSLLSLSEALAVKASSSALCAAVVDVEERFLSLLLTLLQEDSPSVAWMLSPSMVLAEKGVGVRMARLACLHTNIGTYATHILVHLLQRGRIFDAAPLPCGVVASTADQRSSDKGDTPKRCLRLATKLVLVAAGRAARDDVQRANSSGGGQPCPLLLASMRTAWVAYCCDVAQRLRQWHSGAAGCAVCDLWEGGSMPPCILLTSVVRLTCFSLRSQIETALAPPSLVVGTLDCGAMVRELRSRCQSLARLGKSGPAQPHRHSAKHGENGAFQHNAAVLSGSFRLLETCALFCSRLGPSAADNSGTSAEKNDAGPGWPLEEAYADAQDLRLMLAGGMGAVFELMERDIATSDTHDVLLYLVKYRFLNFVHRASAPLWGKRELMLYVCSKLPWGLLELCDKLVTVGILHFVSNVLASLSVSLVDA